MNLLQVLEGRNSGYKVLRMKRNHLRIGGLLRFAKLQKFRFIKENLKLSFQRWVCGLCGTFFKMFVGVPITEMLANMLKKVPQNLLRKSPNPDGSIEILKFLKFLSKSPNRHDTIENLKFLSKKPNPHDSIENLKFLGK